MTLERVETGISGLDPLISGGFPKDSLIIVCGNPGTGKTIFAGSFVYNGITQCGENGVYVSFSEDKRSFYKFMEAFGFNFKKLEEENKFEFIEMVTGREQIQPEAMATVLGVVQRLRAKRLVLDPISAVLNSFERTSDARALVHTVFSKITKAMGCTTLMIVEVPFGSKTMGLGMEEFVADGIISLEKREPEHSLLLRELKILKLRGTRIQHALVAFTLEGGFHVFRPIGPEAFRSIKGRYEIVPHGKEYFSLGICDLDRVVAGMIRQGAYDLLEIESHVVLPVERILLPTICNFLNQDYGVAIIPPQGVSGESFRREIEPQLNRPISEHHVKIVDYKVAGERLTNSQHSLALKGKNILEDMERFWDEIDELRRITGKPVLSIVGFDTLEYMYGAAEILKILGEDVAKIKNFGDVRLNVVRPHVHMAEHLRALSTVHLKICQIDGAPFIYGIKPRTPLLNIESKTEDNIRRIKLTPIV
jgi:KaiC/GvpD/RAD55 family RecA-like ATPase